MYIQSSRGVSSPCRAHFKGLSITLVVQRLPLGPTPPTPTLTLDPHPTPDHCGGCGVRGDALDPLCPRRAEGRGGQGGGGLHLTSVTPPCSPDTRTPSESVDSITLLVTS